MDAAAAVASTLPPLDFSAMGDALVSAAEMSDRYISDRALPDNCHRVGKAFMALSFIASGDQSFEDRSRFGPQ